MHWNLCCAGWSWWWGEKGEWAVDLRAGGWLPHAVVFHAELQEVQELRIFVKVGRLNIFHLSLLNLIFSSLVFRRMQMNLHLCFYLRPCNC